MNGARRIPLDRPARDQPCRPICDEILPRGTACPCDRRCLWTFGDGPEGRWYIEVAPNGIAYTFWHSAVIPF